MDDEFNFDTSDIIAKPCRKCGSSEYDNCDTSDDCIDEDLKTGKIVLEPKTCDKCDLNYMMSDSSLMH